ncbi:hypothetical protein [Flagellimonas meridianipacifica]|uniref:Uncharacterized protein n=1 Tax=Flagellimonas meridianipacifica TaxID=1080225 RepID=A0A2T0M8R7_9FLAO|nr:hypothetical protein [Allomuricauda pacifica]PRX53822.1 hypothetical protein CLV81_2210 [Allomuricauda pacifica]
MSSKVFYRVCGIHYKENPFQIREANGKTYFDKIDFWVFAPGKTEIESSQVIPSIQGIEIKVNLKFGKKGQSRSEIFRQSRGKKKVSIDLSGTNIEYKNFVAINIIWYSLIDEIKFLRPETSGGSILVGT